MFPFKHRSGLRSPSAPLLRALETAGLPPGTDVSTLGVVESHGKYSGRKVTYFRVFDPARAAGRSADVFSNYTYNDLNAHLDLVLRSGHIEQDGAIVVNQVRPDRDETARASASDAVVPSRERADRADHADDERFVSQGSSRP
jgi:hypothetical protein